MATMTRRCIHRPLRLGAATLAIGWAAWSPAEEILPAPPAPLLRGPIMAPQPAPGVHPLEAASGGSLRPLRTPAGPGDAQYTLEAGPAPGWTRATFPPPWVPSYSPWRYVFEPRLRAPYLLPIPEVDPVFAVRPRVIATGIVVEEEDLEAVTWEDPFDLPTPAGAPERPVIIDRRSLLDTPPVETPPADADPATPAPTDPADPAAPTPPAPGGFFDSPAPPPTPPRPSGGFFDF